MDTLTLNEILSFIDVDFRVSGKLPVSGQREVFHGTQVSTQKSSVLKLCVTTPTNVGRIQREIRVLNGLDSETTTTFSLQDETLLVIGASGFAAQEHVQDRESRFVPRKLREWADARLKEFERGLASVARRQAARFSGIATTPALDRWDDGRW